MSLILTITQDDTEGCVQTMSYLGGTDEQAIDHFVDELSEGFLAAVLPAFRKQLVRMVAKVKDGGIIAEADPSVQGILTVTRGSLFRAVPKFERVDR